MIGCHIIENKLVMPERINYEKAIALIPSYMDFLSCYFNPAWNDGVRISPEIQLERFILPKMIERGYSNEKIEKYCSAWRQSANSYSDSHREDGENNVVGHSDFAKFLF